MMNKRVSFLIIFAIAILLIGIAHYSATITGMLVAQNQDVVLIDVRTPEEHFEERIPNSILLPFDTIELVIEERFPEKNTPIALYCRRGNRSEIAKEKLKLLGYTNVVNVGGIVDWTGPKINGNN